jgi:hypothetical protein
MGVATPADAAAFVLTEPLPEALLYEFGRASWNSSIVPHSPHWGQRPNHLTPLHPHSVQTYCVPLFAITARYSR